MTTSSVSKVGSSKRSASSRTKNLTPPQNTLPGLIRFVTSPANQHKISVLHKEFFSSWLVPEICPRQMFPSFILAELNIRRFCITCTRDFHHAHRSCLLLLLAISPLLEDMLHFKHLSGLKNTRWLTRNRPGVATTTCGRFASAFALLLHVQATDDHLQSCTAATSHLPATPMVLQIDEAQHSPLRGQILVLRQQGRKAIVQGWTHMLVASQ